MKLPLTSRFIDCVSIVNEQLMELCMLDGTGEDELQMCSADIDKTTCGISGLKGRENNNENNRRQQTCCITPEIETRIFLPGISSLVHSLKGLEL